MTEDSKMVVIWSGGSVVGEPDWVKLRSPAKRRLPELFDPRQRIEACGDIRQAPEMEYRSFLVQGLSPEEVEILAVLMEGNGVFSRALCEVIRQGLIAGGEVDTRLPDDSSPSERETAAHIWRVMEEAALEERVAEACDPGAEQRRIEAALSYLSRHHAGIQLALLQAGVHVGNWVREHQDEIRDRAEETRRLWREMQGKPAQA